jgi:cyclic pyranopterin phosphate synthase
MQKPHDDEEPRGGGEPRGVKELQEAELSHLDTGGAARMVDVSDKPETRRSARAAGRVRMAEATRRLVAERALPKGDVFTVARVAGVLAAKRTAELIPLCHPLPLTDVHVELTLDGAGVAITATASCVGRTGVEMEALAAVSAAALTVYDMCKSADKSMVIGEIRLLEKTGGRGGTFRREE